MKKINSEKGQIIVILAVALVAIIAITALAIDGSLVYNDRRTDQSTTDSASLAGAGAAAQILKDHKPSDFYCGSSLGATATTAAVQAAIDSAMADDVTLLSQNLSTKNGVQVTCGLDVFGMKYLDVNVLVTTETPTNFGRIISRDSVTTTVQSIARVFPKQPFAFGNGLVSLSDTCGTKSGGIEFGGGSLTYINEAGVFSNSCIKATSGSTEVEVIGGTIQYDPDDGCAGCDTADMTPPATPSPTDLPTDLMDPPKCTTAPFVNAPSSGVMNPGNYKNGISTTNGGSLKLNPGLYCIKGGLENNSKSFLVGDKVTLYFLDGDVTINQNDEGEVTLSSPDCEIAGPTCGVPPAIRGLLMYFSPTYSATVKLNGGSTNSFIGTIYGPKANFTINGGSTNATFNTQIIGNWIEITGGGQLRMDLSGAEMVQKPSSLSLLK